MSSTFDEEPYKTLYDLFNREAKRVEVYKSRNLTENLQLRDEYKQCLVRTYNDLVKIFKGFHSQFVIGRGLWYSTKGR